MLYWYRRKVLAFSLPLACAYLFNLAGDSTCKHSSYFIWYKFKNKTSLANIENNAYICKRKTLLSLLNKQTSGLLFFMHLWQRQNSSVVYGLNPICHPFLHQYIQRG
jgi:hypothetical protein